MITSIIIFLLTYILISGRRLNIIHIGRPAGVLLGAVLMVASRVIRPAQAYALVNWDTIILLLGMMILTEHLLESGFFDIAAERISRHSPSPRVFMAIVVFGTGILAGFLINDIVCIICTPLLLILLRQGKLPPLPFLLALATSTNIGGLLTFTGSPQNMIIGHLSGIPYREHFLLMLPVGLVCLGVNYVFLIVMFKKELSVQQAWNRGATAPFAKPLLKRSALTISCVIAGFFVLHNMAWTALAGAAAIFVLGNRNETDILKRIDWNLLLFFACLFIVTGALHVSGASKPLTALASRLSGDTIADMWLFGLISIAASNVFANVPYVLLIAESVGQYGKPELMWYTLAFASTIAGNLTLIGAVANIIVAEKARDQCEIGFFDFLKFGLPSTVATTLAGLGIMTLYVVGGIL